MLKMHVSSLLSLAGELRNSNPELANILVRNLRALVDDPNFRSKLNEAPVVSKNATSAGGSKMNSESDIETLVRVANEFPDAKPVLLAIVAAKKSKSSKKMDKKPLAKKSSKKMVKEPVSMKSSKKMAPKKASPKASIKKKAAPKHHSKRHASTDLNVQDCDW